MKLIDLTGKIFGRLTIISRDKNKGRDVAWKCKCSCGNYKVIVGHELKSKNTRSCGCYRSESSSKRLKTHGKTFSSEYKAWDSIRGRCNNEKSNNYHSYGGRGITVCKRWETFENFYKDMGDKPSRNYSIDRIDNNGNYEPSNCRWATNLEQQRNKRNTQFITYNNKTLSLPEWCEITGIKYITLYARLKAGWNIELALTCPVK